MKNSRKFFWIVLGVIVAIPVIFLVAFKLTIVKTNANDFKVDNEIINSGDMIEKNYNYKDFTSIKVTGGWDLDVCYGEDFSILVEYYEKFADDYLIEQKGSTLYLNNKVFGKGKLHPHAAGAVVKIVMPALNNVKIEGGADLKMENFYSDNIDFYIDGAAQVVGINCTYDNISILIDGAGNFDFDKSKVKNADVNVNGAANIELTMTGGELTGSLSGIGNISYSGDVALVNVKKDGLGVVERAKN